ncbi:MAG: phosphatidate cytidylyltransferase [Elusimicrobia bacterium]|nr:phosphatidate cytidylyltransferase [Candidatus Obscuribacterium magneticum]
MVLPRVITSILLVPLVLSAVWVGSLPFFLFVMAITLLCGWEYSLMAEAGGYPNQFWMSLFGNSLVLLALFMDGVPWGPLHRSPSVVFVFLFLFFLSFMREFFRRDKSYSFLRAVTTMAGIVLCSFCLGHLLLIRDLRAVGGEGILPIGREMVFFLLFVVWGVDTGAWLIGRLLGRMKMAPKVSPKKTWEGAVGGTLLGCLIGWFFRALFLRESVGGFEAFLFSLAIAIVAQASDLIESLIKRSFGVKNSSDLLPGHGGLLDRFDSFIFSAPFFYYVLIGTGRFN